MSAFETLLLVVAPLLLSMCRTGMGAAFTPANKAELKSKIDDCLASNDDLSSETGECPFFLFEYGYALDGEWVGVVIGAFDVSRVTVMEALFSGEKEFNQPLGAWAVSKVTSMNSMFMGSYTGGHKFHQPLGEWDVSSVTDMESMFNGLSPSKGAMFNHPLEAWDVSNVGHMVSMFQYAFDFNQPLQAWDISSVTEMRIMFFHAYEFNQPLNAWDVSRVTSMDKCKGTLFVSASYIYVSNS